MKVERKREKLKVERKPAKLKVERKREKLKVEGMKGKNFVDLEVWQDSKQLAVDIFKMWENFDSRGYYAMQDQMQRAALSISSNIAEGSERRSETEFIRYLYIAKSSVAELRTQLYILKELEIAQGSNFDGFIERTVVLSKRLSCLISSIDKVE